MGTLIVVDCEAPFGVGLPSVGDMPEFGAVDVNALRDGRTETFHGKTQAASLTVSDSFGPLGTFDEVDHE